MRLFGKILRNLIDMSEIAKDDKLYGSGEYCLIEIIEPDIGYCVVSSEELGFGSGDRIPYDEYLGLKTNSGTQNYRVVLCNGKLVALDNIYSEKQF